MSPTLLQLLLGFPGGSVVKNPTANAGDAGEAGLIPGLERFPGEGNSNLPGKFHGQRSLASCSPWGHKRVGHD